MVHKKTDHRYGLLRGHIPKALLMRFKSYCLENESELAISAKKLKRKRAIISWPGCDRPYRIPTSILNNHSTMTEPQPQNGTYFLGADYLRVTDFVREKREEGRIGVSKVDAWQLLPEPSVPSL